MTQTNLRLTIFEVHKLRHIVGQHGASPYQISTFCGDFLGITGTFLFPATQVAANGDFDVPDPVASVSWLKRSKSFLGA